MKKLIYTFLFCFGLYSSVSNALAADPVIVGYYANWSSVPFTALPANNLDIINYAFASPQIDGSIKLTSDKDDANFKQIPILKMQNPHLKVLLSIGGWTLSQSFSAIADNPTLTEKFANNVLDLMKKYPDLDGIDIDWEYPVSGGDNIPHKPEDKQNYVRLVKSIREKLSTLDNKQYVITIAGPHHNHQGDGGSVSNIDVKGMLQYIDHINVMGYDFHQSTTEPTHTNNDAALYQSPMSQSAFGDSVNDSINDYKSQGLSPSEMNKLIMGIPLYGFAWQGVPANSTEPNHPGLFQTATGPLPNSYIQASDGVFSYADIMNHLISDQKMQAAWSAQYQFSTYYSSEKQSFLTFDDIQTAKAKVAYIQQNSLGGAMFWELSKDTFDKNSLVYQTCLNLHANNTCKIPTEPTAKMKLELTNNDPKNSIIITLVTANKLSYYAFPALSPKGGSGSSVVYDDNNSSNITHLMDEDSVLVLLTSPTNGQQRWCPGKLNMRNASYHHVQVYYDNKPNCLIE